MPMHADISFQSIEFKELTNNNIDFVSNNFDIYEPLKDAWLTVASCFCDLPMNVLFISQGANPKVHAFENFNNAIFQNKLDVVQLYVAHDCILIGNDDVHMGGAIMNAINHDNLDMLKYLISIGCNIHLDSDYAFNRGIADNAINCVTYLQENFDMYYDLSVDYNIKTIIQKNHYQIFDYILNLNKKQLTFDFNSVIKNLFTLGHPEIFDIFVKHGLLNEGIFINNFYSIFYYFPMQEKLYDHIERQYHDWFNKGIHKTMEESEVKSLIKFVVSQNYSNNKDIAILLEREHLNILSTVPFIDHFISSHPYYISEVLLENIANHNNIDLLTYNFKEDYIKLPNIQKVLNNILPQLIEEKFFASLLKIVFQKPVPFMNDLTEFETLNKIYSYYKLNVSFNGTDKNQPKKLKI